MTRQSRTATCIYCRQKKPRKEFTKEHVVPRQFGTFESTLITLLGAVCGECNGAFDQSFEDGIGRDSIEALDRVRYGVLPPARYQGKRDGTLRGVYENGPFAGAHFRWVGTAQGLQDAPIDGVLLRVVGEPARWFELSEIPTRDDARALVAGRTYDWKIPPGVDHEKLRAAMAARGYQLEIGDEIHHPMASGEVRSRIDRNTGRFMAKIAFNYLAKIAGVGFVLLPQFDGVREFIRYDRGDWHEFVRPSVFEGQRYAAHGVLVKKHDNTGWVTAEVLPFFRIRYQVFLSRGPFLIAGAPPLESAHVFDYEKRKVYEYRSSTEMIEVDLSRQSHP